MGVSLRAYAKHRGVSDTAVRKAIKNGRITQLADGSIDVETADNEWLRHTNQAQQRSSTTTVKAEKNKAVPNAAVEAVSATLKESSSAASGTTYMQARTANEVSKAQTNRLKLQQLKGELVDRNKALSYVYRLARAERDAWLSWPSRIASQMAAELGVDAHSLHTLLDQSIREHLRELADISPRVD